MAVMILIFAGCGGGGGGGGTTATAKVATIKLATTGTPSANLAGVGLVITLPDGVTPALAVDGSVASSVVTISGVAAPGTVIIPVYSAASSGVKGKLQIALSSNSVTGFGAGEFAKLVLNVAAGVTVTQADLLLTEFNPIDLSGNVATGLTAGVTTVSLQ